MTPDDILTLILGDMGLEITDRMDTRFYCNCSKERVEKALISIGKKELQNMIDDGKEVEFEIIESTRVNGADYILVTTDDTTIYDSENDDDDSEAVFILKDTAAPESEEALYEFVDDEEELDAVFKIFEQLLDDEE